MLARLEEVSLFRLQVWEWGVLDPSGMWVGAGHTIQFYTMSTKQGIVSKNTDGIKDTR